MNKTQITIAEAAEQWIAMIEAPSTKATPEQKAALISRIREAAPKVKRSRAESFVMATNDIKAVMNA